jgi:hypothetical protein
MLRARVEVLRRVRSTACSLSQLNWTYGGWFAGTWRSSSSAQRSPAGDCRQGLIWQLMTAKHFGCDRMRTMAFNGVALAGLSLGNATDGQRCMSLAATATRTLLADTWLKEPRLKVQLFLEANCTPVPKVPQRQGCMLSFRCSTSFWDIFTRTRAVAHTQSPLVARLAGNTLRCAEGGCQRSCATCRHLADGWTPPATRVSKLVSGCAGPQGPPSAALLGNLGMVCNL